jgi:O-acetyl-ADP-ribose deacetylase (regulator of RNase III)
VGVKDHIHIIQGDLTEEDADAIVNAANTDLQLGGGVAGAIRYKGGPEIQQQCNHIGPIPLGEAAVTGGGNLRAHYVIHAASMRLGEATREENLRLATRNVLLRAKEHGLKSIAFPAIGTGIAGFPMRRCAEVMLEEIAAHLRGATSLEDVRLVLYDHAARHIFLSVYEALPE